MTQPQTYAKASNPANWDRFGHSVALSADAGTLVVGAVDEDGAELDSGAVYLY